MKTVQSMPNSVPSGTSRANNAPPCSARKSASSLDMDDDDIIVEFRVWV